jgi:large subunit ribosomal protein L15
MATEETPADGAAEKPAKKTAAKKTATKAAGSGAATATKAPAKRAAKKTESAEAGTARVPAPATYAAAGTLKVHHLRPAAGARTAKVRVGRGEGGKGKTAGRGTKGTKARYQVSAGFEGGQTPMHMRLPKLRGFKNPFRVEYQVVNLDKLGSLFPEGGAVTVEDLVDKGAVRKGQLVKVLGTGEITVALQVSADKFSTSARDKIAAAGGSTTEL